MWARRVIAQRLADGTDRAALVTRMHGAADPLLSGSAPASAEQIKAVFLLAELRDGTMIDQLRPCCAIQDVLMRQHATFLLGQDGSDRALPGLITAMGDSQALVRQTARDALQAIAGRGQPTARAALGQPNREQRGGGHRPAPASTSSVVDQGSLSQSGSPLLSVQQVPDTSLQATSGFTPSRWQSESCVQLSIVHAPPWQVSTGTIVSHCESIVHGGPVPGSLLGTTPLTA